MTANPGCITYAAFYILDMLCFFECIHDLSARYSFSPETDRITVNGVFNTSLVLCDKMISLKRLYCLPEITVTTIFIEMLI